MASKRIHIDGSRLTIDDVVAVARNDAAAALTAEAKARMKKSRAWVERAVKNYDTVYGVTTGFGANQDKMIPREKIRELQRNLILSHCAGVGEPLSDDVVRAMMLLRANALAKGYSGICVSTVQVLLDMLSKAVHPVVPSQGSVGASGDLAPLSHMAAVVIGEGEAVYRKRRLSGVKALAAAGLKPVKLEAKEGLALNNGTQAMSAIGVLAVHDAQVLADAADVAAALTLEAVKGKSAPFQSRVHALRPHAGQALSASHVRMLIKGSRLVDLVDDDTRGKVQDSYSVRCVPQVHGASQDAITYVRSVLETEINSATDNPLIFADDGGAISAGNFHGQPVALAMDHLSLAVAELGDISERRTAKLLDKDHNAGLPAFLAANGGVESGLMIAQYTAAALVSENKSLIHPASGDSIPTSANQEDHVSMGTIAARHASEIIRNTRRVLAIEMLCAVRAIGLRREKPGTRVRSAISVVRKTTPRLKGDAPLSGAIEAVSDLIASGVFSNLIRQR